MGVASPTWTVRGNLPSVTVAVGQTRTSAAINVPLSVQQLKVEIDGTAWPADSVVYAEVDVSDDGGVTWPDVTSITTSKANLQNNLCSVGVLFPAPNANSSRRVRGVIKVLSGSTITLVGTVSTA